MDDLLQILCNALMGASRKYNAGPDTVIEALREAERQTVVGIAFNEIGQSDVKLEKADVFYYMGLCQQIKQQNGWVNIVLKDLALLLNSHGIRYAVVKGQITALSYPDPMLRQSGDIDFFCDEKDFERTKSLIEKEWGVTFKGDRSNHHHIEFERNGILVEMHHKLIKLYRNRDDDYWKELCKQPFSQVMIDGAPVSTLSPTLHALYTFLHLDHHLLELGVGLRQFCDLAVLLHGQKEAIDKNALRQYLSALGMVRAYKACGTILVDYLGMSENELGYQLTKGDRCYGRNILDVVSYRGNFGHYNKRAGVRGWEHNMEATGIKVAHFAKFVPLAPSFSTRWLLNELKRKIILKA